MSDNAYGVVVGKEKSRFSIWLLFSGSDGHLTSLDPSVSSDALHIGDIVQARSERNAMRISRCCPFPDSVWSDGRRVIIRTVVSFNRELTLEQGTWKDETDLPSVRMLSRDIGIIVVPTNWYRREFCDVNEHHLFAYVQFFPLSLTKTETGERVNYYWTIMGDRISLPASLPKIENPDKFSVPYELRKVPAFTLLRQGLSMIVWSYTLGDHLAIIMVDNKAEPGEWMEVSVVHSSARDFESLGCTYTVLRHSALKSYSQPEVTMANKTIQMTLTLNRSELDPDNPNAEVKVWHDFWGLPIDYDPERATWIRGESNQFKAIVQVGLSPQHGLHGRRVTIKVVAPATMPRLAKGPAPPAHLRTAAPAFEDIDKLKKALHEAERSTDNSNNGDKCADRTMSKIKWSDDDLQKPKKTPSDTPQQSDPKEKAMSGDWSRIGSEGSVAPRRNAPEIPTSVGSIPIRTRDDKRKESEWRWEMREQGWAWPDEIDGDGNSDSRDSSRFQKEKIGHAQNPLRKRALIIDLSSEDRIKVMQCLITRVRFDLAWKDADRIELYILDNTPAFIVHKMGDSLGNENLSCLKNSRDFTTVGNVVELRVGRNGTGWYVCDEMWRLVMKVPLPMREAVFEPGRTRTLELLVNAKCLSPEAQDRHNDRHRYDNKGFIMLQDEILHNICYYGWDIDAREHNDFIFQMVVVPEECLDGHAFWKVKDLCWRIPFGPGIPKPRPPVHMPATVRETTIEELFSIYAKLMQNENLMDALFDRTGINFRRKFTSAMEVWQLKNAEGLRNRHKREIECNENFLFTIVENSYTEGIFRKQGEKILWKLLVTTVDSIRDWRRHSNNR